MLFALDFNLKYINCKLITQIQKEKPGIMVSSIQQFHFAPKFLANDENKFIPVNLTNTDNRNSSFPWSTPKTKSDRKLKQNLQFNSDFEDDPNQGFIFVSVTPSAKSNSRNKNIIQTQSTLKTTNENISTIPKQTSFSVTFDMDDIPSTGLSNDDLFNPNINSNSVH